MSDEENNVQAIIEEQTSEQAAAEQAAAEQAAAEQAAAEQAAAEQAAAEKAAAEQAAAEKAAAEKAAAEKAAAEKAAAEQTHVEDEESYFKKVLSGEIEMTEKDEEKIYSKLSPIRQNIIDITYNKDEKRKSLLVFLKKIKF